MSEMWKTALLLLSLFALLTSCVSANPELFPPQEDATTHSVWIVNHRWHTGIVIRRADVPQGLMPELEDFANYDLVEIGWGERDFYMDAGDSALLAIKAMFWPNKSVMHVVGVKGDLAATFQRSSIVRIELSEQGFATLCHHLDRSFARAEGHTKARHLGTGLYGPSAFYEAHGTFSILNVCNKWTANALRAGGLPIRSWNVLSASQVLERVAEFGTVVQERD